jgi:uncharacterized membrane protein
MGMKLKWYKREGVGECLRVPKVDLSGRTHFAVRKESNMLWTIGVILLILWLLGFLGHVGGGLIHILLVIAIVVVLIQVIQGRR